MGFLKHVKKAVSHAVKHVVHDVTHPQDVIKTAVKGVSNIGHGVDDLLHGHIKEGLGEVVGGAKNVLDPAHMVGEAHQLARPITNPINKALAQGIKGVTGHNVLGSHPLNTVGTVAASVFTAGAAGALAEGASLGASLTAGLGSLEGVGGTIASSVGTGLSNVGLSSAGATVSGWGSALQAAAAQNAYVAGASAASTAGSSVANAQPAAFTEGAGTTGGFNPTMLTKEGAQAAAQANLGDGAAITSGLTSTGEAGMAGGSMYGGAGVMTPGVGFQTSNLAAEAGALTSGGATVAGPGYLATQAGGGFYGSALTTGGAFSTFGSGGFKAMLNSAANEGLNQLKNINVKGQQGSIPGVGAQGGDGGWSKFLGHASMGDKMELSTTRSTPMDFQTQRLDLDTGDTDLSVKQFQAPDQFQVPSAGNEPVNFTAFKGA